MRRRLPRLSVHEVVELLVRKFRFTVKRQRGSHVALVKCINDRKIVTVVPLHPELKPGTLLGVLELAGINREELLKAYGALSQSHTDTVCIILNKTIGTGGC